MNGIIRNLIVITAAGLLLMAAACVSGNADHPSTPDIELQVMVTESPAVTAQDQSGTCVIKVNEWTVNFNNVPKNSLATTSPWNDVTIVGMTLSYDFPDVGATLPTRYLPLGEAVTVPAAGSATLKFWPVYLQDLISTPEVLGSSGNMVIEFQALMNNGHRFDKAIGEVIAIEQCVSQGG